MAMRQRKQDGRSTLVEKIEEVEKTVEKTLLILWDELPTWQRDNHYIFSGYRSASGSFWRSFASLGYIHNESVNIWSHLLGALTFTAIGTFMYSKLSTRYSSATSEDVLAFGCFFTGAALCLGMSATYHTISNHSHTVARFGNKLDYVGIVSLIVGSFIPSIYYGFYCHPNLQETYWTMICSLGLGCTAVSIIDRFRTPEWRPYRAAMFVAMGLSAVVPILHGLTMFTFSESQAMFGLTWMLLEGFLYITGAGLYAARWPERSNPGAFDIWGSSHQIFHVLVLLAAASHLYSLILAFDTRHNSLGLKC